MDESSAFKNLINKSVMESMAEAFLKAHPHFNRKRFLALAPELKALELKQRVLLLTKGLRAELTQDYAKDIKIVMKVLKQKKLTGFQLWPVSEYIGQFGTDHFEESFSAMYLLTQQFTSEFAIRPFLLKDHAQSLKILSRWVEDEITEVRRWVSEGTRPLLPWGAKIPKFVESPMLTIPFLEALKNDEELFVRKSVANHLNDISKHHPELVVKTIGSWVKSSSPEHLDKINWIKRHGLRTLIKKGHPGALKLMGVKGECEVEVHSLKLNKKEFSLGDSLEFDLSFSSTSKIDQTIIIDYLIHFMKSNGSLSHKVFKFKKIELRAGEKIQLKKKHSLKKITTMTFYPGKHELSIQINGKIFKKVPWIFDP